MLTTKPAFPGGPKPRFPGDFLMQLHRDPLRFLQRLADHGDVAGMRLGRMQAVAVTRPELVHRVLVTDAASYTKGRGLEVARRVLGDGLLTSEGELHKRQRQLLQPVFQARKVERFAPVVQAWSDRLVQRWPARGEISASSEMTRLTLEIVGESLFGTNLEEDVLEVRAAMKETLGMFQMATLPFYELGEKLMPWLRRKFDRQRGRLDAVVLRMIADHRQRPQDDLLGRIVENCDDDELVRDEAMTLFLAGHETTAHALTFALYLLARHPEEQERVRAELADRPLELEQLPLLKNVLLETLRLYPPAWMVGRRAAHEIALGDHTLRSGCTVLMSPFVIHRLPEYFPEPLRFRPDRWTERPRTALPKLCYFPFGAGPRVCIGEHFAWVEMAVGLGTILRNFRLVGCPVECPRLHPGITLSPSDDLPISVERIAGREPR